MKQVALGHSIPDWVDERRQSYSSDPRYQGRNEGELEQLVWDDLPEELQVWVPRPEPRPLGLLKSWHHVLKSEEFCFALWKCLDTTRRVARAKQGGHWCKTCNPNDHRGTKRPRGSFVKRMLFKLKNI